MDGIKRKKGTALPDSEAPSERNNDIYLGLQNNLPPPGNRIGNKKSAKNYGKGFLIFFIISFTITLFWVIFFSWKIHSTSKKIIITNDNNSSFVSSLKSIVAPIITNKREELKGEEKNRINILLLGAAGEGKAGKNLTDTIMIMSINTQTKKLALLSLPRDLYVKIPETKSYSKINSLYQYGLSNNEGVETVKKSVEEITGLDINYYLIINYDGFKKVIDDLGGVNVYVERDIYDTRFPGSNFSYETFKLEKGLHKMDGETALKFVRERHNDPEGDFGRAKRQQNMIQAGKSKFFSFRTLLNVFALNKILDDLGNNVKTDIQIDEIEGLLAISREVDSQNITNAVADAWEKDSLLKVSHVFYGNIRAFILVPRVGNWSEIQELSENIFDLDAIRRKEAEIEKENVKITVINQSSDRQLASKIRDLLESKMKFKSVIVKSPPTPDIREETAVYDRTGKNKIFSLNEIIKKLPARLPPEDSGIIDAREDSDLVIVLGRDLEEKYSFEEDSIEEFNKAQELEF